MTRGRKTTKAKVEAWNTVFPLLQAMHREFKELSKKKPEAASGKSKLSIVNRLLQRCRIVLADEASLEFLDLLDEDNMPQNSDVVLSLSQYVAAMEQFSVIYHEEPDPLSTEAGDWAF